MKLHFTMLCPEIAHVNSRECDYVKLHSLPVKNECKNKNTFSLHVKNAQNMTRKVSQTSLESCDCATSVFMA